MAITPKKESISQTQTGISDKAIEFYILSEPSPTPISKSEEMNPENFFHLNKVTRDWVIHKRRKSEFIIKKTTDSTESVVTIPTVIKTVEEIISQSETKNENLDEKEEEKKLDELSERTDSLVELSIQELDWRNYLGLKQIDFNYMISPLGLLSHEYKNLVNNFVGYMSFIKISKDEKTKGDIRKKAGKAGNSIINILTVLNKFVREKDQDGYSLKELFATFTGQPIGKIESLPNQITRLGKEGKEISINLNFEFDTPDFDTFEEFLSIRTLIDNAAKENGISSINVRRIDVSEDGKSKVYVIEDDAPLKDFEKFSKSLQDAKELASNYMDEPVFIEQRGGRVVALMAGRRGDEIWTEIDPQTNKKSIYVTFAGKDQTGKNIREEFEKKTNKIAQETLPELV